MYERSQWRRRGSIALIGLLIGMTAGGASFVTMVVTVTIFFAIYSFGYTLYAWRRRRHG